MNLPNIHTDWNSPKTARKVARVVQAALMKERCPGIPRFRAVQLGIVPSQEKIFEGLCSGLYQEYL